MDAMFAAVDMAGVNTNVSTLLIAFIGIGMLFMGYRLVRKCQRAV